MELTRPSPLARSNDVSSAQIAKAALRRLAVQRLEPTPENYERAWRHEAGDAPLSAGLPAAAKKLVEKLAGRALEADIAVADEISEAMLAGHWELAEQALDKAISHPSDSLASLIDRLVRGIEKNGRNWTLERRKEGFQRVLAGSRGDARKLQHRLSQLVASWESDSMPPADASPSALAPLAAAPLEGATSYTDLESSAPSVAAAPAALAGPSEDALAWERIARRFGEALRTALPRLADGDSEAAVQLASLVERLRHDAVTAELEDEVHGVCGRAERVALHRHHLFEQLGKLCHELTASLADLAENESWVKGQCEAMRAKIEEGLTARGVRQVSDMLHNARQRHSEVRIEREDARDALKALITQMIGEIGELGSKTGEFHQSMSRYSEVIEKSDSLQSLTGVVREIVAESRSVQSLVQQTQERLQHEHTKASGLTERVTQLEDEMRRLSDEVSTDQLTQIANRRGLMQAFEAERARVERGGGVLSIGLLDIDNFKRLNDELGHSAGDEALKALAAIVSKTLRPTDRVARYGGEEFVVLLPETPVDEGEVILTRLQRALTGGLFMHKDKQVFVTFSAGVTSYRLQERIEDSLERADQALYEAKRTGKNRTCIA